MSCPLTGMSLQETAQCCLCLLKTSVSRSRLRAASVINRFGVQDQWHRQPLKQPLQSLLRSLPIFHRAGCDPVEYISLPEGSFLAPAGCQPELLQQVCICGHVILVLHQTRVEDHQQGMQGSACESIQTVIVGPVSKMWTRASRSVSPEHWQVMHMSMSGHHGTEHLMLTATHWQPALASDQAADVGCWLGRGAYDGEGSNRPAAQNLPAAWCVKPVEVSAVQVSTCSGL